MKYYIKPAIKGLCVSKDFCVNIPISDTTTPEESESNTGFFEEESNSVRKVGPWGEE